MGRLSKEAKEAKTYAAINAVLWSATQEFAKANKYEIGVAVVDGKSEKRKEFEKAMLAYYASVGSWVYMQPHLTLFEIATGEKFPLKELQDLVNKKGMGHEALKWNKFAVVMVEGCQNGHNYPVGKLAVMAYGEKKSGIMHDGSYGNSLSGYKNEVRPATQEELKTLTKYQYATLLREFFIQIP